MDAEWVRWIVGTLVLAVASLAWYEVRRIGKNLHQLRTDISTMLLPIERDVRELQRTTDQITGQLREAAAWREMVLELIRGRPRT